jgi:hypothetical protein
MQAIRDGRLAQRQLDDNDLRLDVVPAATPQQSAVGNGARLPDSLDSLRVS